MSTNFLGVGLPQLATRAIAYVRVSSEKQATLFVKMSMETQAEAIRAFARANNLGDNIPVVYEVCSASLARGVDKLVLPALEGLVRRLKVGTVILVFDSSRFARSEVYAMRMLEKINAKGCTVHAINNTVNSVDEVQTRAPCRSAAGRG